MAMHDPTTSAPTPMRERLEQLRSTRDELRVKAHLAGMDAHAAWDRFEPKLATLEAKIESMTEGATHELSHALDEFGAALVRFRDKLDRIARDWARDE